jgi:hypothetical protein
LDQTLVLSDPLAFRVIYLHDYFHIFSYFIGFTMTIFKKYQPLVKITLTGPDATGNVVPAWLGLKAVALAWLKGALTFSKFRPGQSCHSWLGLGLGQPRPWLCIQWLKKLSQCLATLERLACHKSNNIDNNLEIIYVI